MLLVTPRRIIALTISAALIAGGAVASVGVQSYVSAREEAFDARRNARLTSQSLNTLISRQEALVAASVRDALAAVAESEGKTFNSDAAVAVTSATEDLAAALDLSIRDIAVALDSIAAAEADFEDLLLWPPHALISLNESLVEVDRGALEEEFKALEQRLDELAEARAAWQAEQDRIAAEKAAAEEAARQAAARRAAAKSAGSTLSPSGGQTAPNETVITDPPVTGYDAEGVMRSYAGYPFNMQWPADLCDEGYLCGVTSLGAATPTVYLDSDLREYYASAGGQYVLIHEAVHVRQWYRYKSISALIAASLAATGFPPEQYIAAVERMADCATKFKTNYGYMAYSPGACTEAEMNEAETYWTFG